MKEMYESPAVEIVKIDKEDIIFSSPISCGGDVQEAEM